MDNRTFDDFDGYAKDYRNIHSKNVRISGADSYYFAEMRVKMLQAFEKNQPTRVLDLGCGDGASEIFMQRYFSKWQVEGIDVSRESIEMAQKRNLPNSHFAAYDGIHIPFPAASFDIVFIAGVLHHVAFNLHDELMEEVRRVLTKGGRIIMFEHNPLNPLTKYLVRTCVFDQDARLLKSSYLTRLLQQHHFNISNRLFFIFIPPLKWLRPFLFIEKLFYWLPLGGKYLVRAIKQ